VLSLPHKAESQDLQNEIENRMRVGIFDDFGPLEAQ
jgi:hypothetical protein